MLIKIIKSVFKYLDIKHLALYTFANLLNVFSKYLSYLVYLPFYQLYLLINQQQPQYLLKVSEYINTDFFLNKDISFYLFILLATFVLKHVILLVSVWAKLNIQKYIVSNLYKFTKSIY